MGFLVKNKEDIDEYNYVYCVPKYYREVTGSSDVAALLAQIKYWWIKMGEKPFYKSFRKFAEDTGISKRRLERAAKVLVELGFIEKTIKPFWDQPRMTWWVFKEKAVQQSICEYASLRKANKIKSIIEGINMDGDTVAPHGDTVAPHGDTVAPHGDTYKYTTSDTILNSSSLEAPPSEAHPVSPQPEEKEEDNIYYGKSEQPADSPLQSVAAPVNSQAQPLAANEDMKVVAIRMIEDWNSLCPVAKVELNGFMFGLHDRFLDSFNCSFDEWKAYCTTIARSKFLMGERAMKDGSFYELSLGWALSRRNIEKVRNGGYDKDREVPKAKEDIITEEESVIAEITNSSEESCVINLRNNLLKRLDLSTYVSWFRYLKIKRKDGKLLIMASSSFRCGYIQEHYLENIKDAMSSVGIVDDLIICVQSNMGIAPIASNQPSPQIILDEESRSIDVKEAIQSFADNMRMHKRASKPAIPGGLLELSGNAVYQTAPSVRNALLKANARFANGERYTAFESVCLVRCV